MRWRSKFLVLLVVYFAGFATAIYCLAPASDKIEGESVAVGDSKYQDDVGSKSEKFASVFNAGMRKFLSFAEERSVEARDTFKRRLVERQQGSEK